MLLRITQAFEKTFDCRSNRKNSRFRFCNFTVLAEVAGKERSELNSFANMVAKIDIDALKM